ncbi:MAG: flavin reductase family protein [Candidatus Omnitrophica bacterium]|nr:flavin reductase family protein [Candidatus Omnitrophota bacterium]
MKKIKIGAKTFLYPMPTVLVGSTVNSKPNYATVAYCGIMNHDPAVISIALNKTHYTNSGIKEHGVFSVNIPPARLMAATDYCGIFSGQRIDKTGIFKTFTGSLKKAPMIEECAINLECELIQTLQFSVDEVFIGRIVQAYCEKKYMTKGLPDIKKMDPIIFSMHDYNYWAVGRHLGRAWSAGEKYKVKSQKARSKK